ncbi:transposase [Lyngbya aestuarii]|uniref:transposase n=1 Tax=Lyngbya aestuarii TaxID=118322 RepID=UPI00193E50B6
MALKLVPKLWEGAWVILDNCSIHKGERIRQLIEKAGAKLLYLPTYSPEFNPIENCWRVWAPLRRHLNLIQVNGAVKTEKYLA